MDFQPLKDFLDSYLPMLGIPGSDTVVWKDGEEVFRYQSGFDSLRMRTPVRPDAMYNLYSCSKVSTCVAATQLIERGEILPTDPLYAYFPEFRHVGVLHKNPDGTEEIREATKPITLGQLLTMTSGLDYDLNRPGILRVRERTGGRCPTLDIVRALAEDPLRFEPGTDYLYSLSLDVIAGVIELVSGKKFSEYLSENVFLPLGMTDSTFEYTDSVRARLATQYDLDAKNRVPIEIPIDKNFCVLGSEYESGGGGLLSSVHDQILLADALTRKGLGKNGNRILSPYGVELMRANGLDRVQLDTFHKIGPHVAGYGYGYGVRTNLAPHAIGNLMPAGEFGWDGAKSSYISACPESGIAVFHAEHISGMQAAVQPRLRNIIYSCVG